MTFVELSEAGKPQRALTAIIGRTLGHKSTQSTAVYARLNIDPVRDSVEKATQAMLQTMKRGDPNDTLDSL